MSLTPEQIYIYQKKKKKKTLRRTVMQTAVKPWTYAHMKKAVVNNMHFTIFQEPFIFLKTNHLFAIFSVLIAAS